MKLALTTINYNGSENTIKLLKSLAEQIDNDFRILVIDNASEEVDFNQLSNFVNRTTCDVVLLRNVDNLGFSGGNNVGIRKALENGVEWVLLLNNDTWVEPDFISSLRPILAPLVGSGQVTSGIVGIPMKENGQIAPSTRLRTSYCGKVEWLKPTLSHIYQTIDNRLSTIDYYVIGGAMAIHKSVFDKIGLLDEKYFLYFEDADYTIRARKANIPVSIALNVMIYHNASSSTKKLGSSLLLQYHYRNALYFNWKNGPWYIKLAVWPWSWWVITKQMLKVMIYHNREQSLAILKGVLDFYKNKYGKI